MSTASAPGKEGNPFQPPSANLERPATGGALFFTTHPVKLLVMSLVTFGVYPLYWFYCNFKVIRDNGQPKIMPFWRAFFSVIWSYTCFNAILRSDGWSASPGRSPLFLAIAYAVLSALSRLPDPWWLVSFLAVLPVMVANGWARERNEARDPEYDGNSRLNGWNWLGIVLGIAWWLLIISAMAGLLPEE